MLKKVFVALSAGSILLYLGIFVTEIYNIGNEALIEEKQALFKCGRYPKEQHITTDNIVWQVLQLPVGFVKLLNAYVDTRQNLSLVRINANSVPLNISVDSIFCQFWFDNQVHPFISRATAFEVMWIKEWGFQPKNKRPYLINCPIEFNGTIPKSVSLTAQPCDHAENLLLIINPQPVNGTKKTFAVCSKQISYENRDFGIRLIEWMHLMLNLGAQKVYFFNRYLHPDIFKIVNYFESKDLLETWPFLEPSGISDNNPKSWQAYLLEMNMLNDCFYRVKNLYEYVLVVDFDEVILPKNPEDMTWHDLLKRLQKVPPEHFDAYVSDNVYYPNFNRPPIEGIPSYLYILQHTQRSVNYSLPGHAVKSFMSTKRTKVVHNHTPLKCISDRVDWCHKFPIDREVAHNSHYRSFMDNSIYNITIEDKTIWKLKDQLIHNVQETLDATAFQP